MNKMDMAIVDMGNNIVYHYSDQSIIPRVNDVVLLKQKEFKVTCVIFDYDEREIKIIVHAL